MNIKGSGVKYHNSIGWESVIRVLLDESKVYSEKLPILRSRSHPPVRGKPLNDAMERRGIFRP